MIIGAPLQAKRFLKIFADYLSEPIYDEVLIGSGHAKERHFDDVR